MRHGSIISRNHRNQPINMKNTFDILLLTQRPDEINLLTKELNRAGYAVRPHPFTTIAELTEYIPGKDFDCGYCFMHTTVFNRVCSIFQEHAIPLIATTYDMDTALTNQALTTGACDLVSYNQPENLRLVSARTLNYKMMQNEMRRYQKASQENEKRWLNLLENSRDAIAYITDGMHIRANPVYLHMFGLEDFQQLEGLPWLNLIAEEERGNSRQILNNFQKEEQEETEHDITCLRIDGTEFEATLSLQAAHINDERCIQLTLRDNASDINKWLGSKTEDTGTGLNNRQAFVNEVEQAIADVKEKRNASVIFYIDVDRFSDIQEQIGLEKTNHLTLTLGQSLSQALGPADFGANFGEHIFAVLTRLNDSTAVQEHAAKLKKAMSIDIPDQNTPVTVSIGIAALHSTTNTPYEALTYADIACQTARKAGGNQAMAYKDTSTTIQQKALHDNARWKKILENAMNNNLFHVVFQPIANFQNTLENIYKVYIRLNDEKGNKVENQTFMEKAERVGMSRLIDQWTIRRILYILNNKLEQTPDNVGLQVKLSRSALRDKNLWRQIYEELKKNRIKARDLIIEITESVALQNYKETLKFALILKKMKCRLAISEYGKNNQMRRLLPALTPDFVTLHADLTRYIEVDAAALNQVQECVEELHEQSISVGVVHVEKVESMPPLFQCGIDRMQGNFIQKPEKEMNFDIKNF